MGTPAALAGAAAAFACLAAASWRLRRAGLKARALSKTVQELNAREDDLQAAVQDLSRDKAQLSAMLSNMVEAVVAVDAEGRIAVVNPALSRLFSIDAREAIGKLFLEALRHSRLSELIDFVLAVGHGRVDEVSVFTPEEHVFEAHALPLTEGDRRVGALLVLHDITRIRRLEQVRKDFVANVSHELRTPLASIKGFAETLIAGAIDDAEHRLEFVKDIEDQADRMTRLVDELLELSAIESGKRLPIPEPLDLLETARQVAAGLKPLARRKDVSVSVQEEGGPLRVEADKAQMRQVFTNLIENAIKFNKQGGSVRVSASEDGQSAVVSVQDTGPGIPAQDLPRLFERFYRVDKARSREVGGTGLGLSIVKHIVESHGGAVSVESSEGRGSTFRFTLPIHS